MTRELLFLGVHIINHAMAKESKKREAEKNMF